VTKNWLEEVVAQLWKLKGYLVLTNLDIILQRGDRRRVSGHSDLDVLAYREHEVIFINCEVYWQSNSPERLDHVKEVFDTARAQLPNKFPFLASSQSVYKRIIVTHGKPKKLSRFCSENGIELMTIKEAITALIREIKAKYPTSVGIVGREESYITRFLMQLIWDGFIQIR